MIYCLSGKIVKKTITAVKKPSHGKQYSIPIAMPKLTCVYLVREPDAPKQPSAKKPAAKRSASKKKV